MICSNPSCSKAGIDQPAENFPKGRRRCKACIKEDRKAWDEKYKAVRREKRRWIPDDDPEDDLKPGSIGDGSWSRLTR